ncbi:MAG: hypothetical protein JWN04_5013 [Myxococcaceae bacterium]|nr:hypothetical protein [Myxococcaceae bacterium]
MKRQAVRASRVVASLLTLAGALDVLGARVPSLHSGSVNFWAALTEDFVARSLQPVANQRGLPLVEEVRDGLARSTASVGGGERELLSAEAFISMLECVARRVSSGDFEPATATRGRAGEWSQLVVSLVRQEARLVRDAASSKDAASRTGLAPWPKTQLRVVASSWSASRTLTLVDAGIASRNHA